MPDYLTKFSCRLDTGSARNAARAVRRLAAYHRLIETRRPDIDYPGFDTEVDPMEDSPGGIWIHDGDGMGDPDHVIAGVLDCAQRFDLKGRWGFSWSYDCSRPVLDAFGGGACVLDLGTRTVIADLDCGCWLDEMIRAALRFMIYSPSEAQAGEGGGYWSNDDGWVDLDHATIFTWSERKVLGRPASLGNDADWIEIDAGAVPVNINMLPETTEPATKKAVP